MENIVKEAFIADMMEIYGKTKNESTLLWEQIKETIISNMWKEYSNTVNQIRYLTA